MDRRTIIYIVVGIVLVVILEVVIFFVIRKKKAPQPRDPGSYSRLERLNNVMKSRFGNNWPFTLIFILILLLGMLVMLYFLLRKETIVWNVSDKTGLILSRVGMALGILIALTLVGLGTYAFIKDRRDRIKQQEDSGDFATTTKGTQILELVGVGIALLLVLGIIGWHVYKHFRHQSQS